MSMTDVLSHEDLAPAPAIMSDLTPEAMYEKCWTLANNLWWMWHPDVTALFRDLDPVKWRTLDHNPVALLKDMTPEQLAARAAEMVLYSRINHAYRRLREYMETRPAWGKTHAGVLGARPVAYFSAEFGIHESVPIYSGGLGVLSGDHIKSASGLGVPMVAVGLFYDQGYFRQHLDEKGYQREEYIKVDTERFPCRPATDPDGNEVMVTLHTRTGQLQARVWRVLVGRVKLFLLDCNIPGNRPEDRELTSRLYGGDERIRIRQEHVLGVGGFKALTALGIHPGCIHLNEGHSAFAPLEAIRQRMHEDGLNFDDALRMVARQTVFTTHTPVPAGHDRFDAQMVEEHLGPLRDELGISYDQFMGLGRVEPHNHGEPFCMTVLGLKLSRKANAVSSLHGHVSRKMWANLYSWKAEEEVPIGHITNGVHVQSWLAPQMAQLYDRNFPADWSQRIGRWEVWQKIYDVDPGELWETHVTLKSLLLSFVRRRVARQCRRRNESEESIEAMRNVLDPRYLTIGFARRFATYKRAALLFNDEERLLKLINDKQRPVQFIFAGKAHPKDEGGKGLIQRIENLRHDPRFAGKVVFVEDYDINVCRHLIQGVDVWLNNPRRPLEASGTSGQKVVLNGGLNCSILDGWWAEAYDGENGFAIGHGHTHVDDRITDERDAQALYDVLETQVIPTYYDRDPDGLARGWVKMMMNSIASNGWRFSSDRMVMDYTTHAYVPAAGGVSCDV